MNELDTVPLGIIEKFKVEALLPQSPESRLIGDSPDVEKTPLAVPNGEPPLVALSIRTESVWFLPLKLDDTVPLGVKPCEWAFIEIVPLGVKLWE